MSQSLRGVLARGAWNGEAVRVKGLPALCAFEFHPVEPHGYLRHVLDVDLEEYLVALERVEEGRRGFRGMNFGLNGQGVGDLSQPHEILSTHTSIKGKVRTKTYRKLVKFLKAL